MAAFQAPATLPCLTIIPGAGSITLTNATTVGGIKLDMTLGVNAFGVGTAAAGPASSIADGGVVQITAASVTATSLFFNSPVVLAGNTATFADYSPISSTGIKINSSISGGVAGVSTITLDSENVGTSAGTAASQWIGAISDGVSSQLNIVKIGTKNWDIRATSASPNTYTGKTILNAGLIRFNGTGAISPNSDYIANGTGNIRISVAGNTMKP